MVKIERSRKFTLGVIFTPKPIRRSILVACGEG